MVASIEIGRRLGIRRRYQMILDYEYPRLGLIRIDPLDQVLVSLRESMQ